MFHADHSIWQSLAQLMIAFLFVFRFVSALPRFEEHAVQIASRGVPFPKLVLTGGLAFMAAGGTMVALDWFAWAGAAMLIVFTLSANYLYHNFWDLEGAEKNRHLYIFCNNVAVMGGLVLVILS